MKKIMTLMLALGLAGFSFAQNLPAELDSVMIAYQKMHHFNGSVLVAKGGHILLEKGYGYKDFKSGSLNDAQTVFMIASATKPFTAIVVLKLADAHKLSLRDPLSKYFPAYPNGGNITIYNLLTHTGGIPDPGQDSVFSATHKNWKLSEALITYGKADFAPGTDWKYSNQGYQLLGEIIEKVSGMTYYQAVRHYIFTPLHMTHSGFDFTHLKNKDKATGYWTWPENGKTEEATLIDSATSYSAGSIYSTVSDLYKWHRALQSYRIVRKALMDQAYKPFRNHYGLGWFVDSLYGKRVVSHSGDTWGFKSNVARVTEDDICVILLNNIEDEEMRGPLTNNLLAALYRQPYHLPVFHQEIQLTEATLQKYTGTYELGMGMTIDITLEDGGLWLQPAGQPKSRIYPEKENFFFSRVVDGQVEFVADSSGKTTTIILYQAGHAMPPGKKIK
ncbi:MAG: serine hydrolase [Mucilaginibacter sp.]